MLFPAYSFHYCNIENLPMLFNKYLSHILPFSTPIQTCPKRMIRYIQVVSVKVLVFVIYT